MERSIMSGYVEFLKIHSIKTTVREMSYKDDDWWKTREKAIDRICGLIGYDENGSLMHLSTKTLRNLAIMIHDSVEMRESMLITWEKVVEDLDYAIGWEQEEGDPRKRNNDYSELPKWYFES